jgi:hypothetical protein
MELRALRLVSLCPGEVIVGNIANQANAIYCSPHVFNITVAAIGLILKRQALILASISTGAYPVANTVDVEVFGEAVKVAPAFQHLDSNRHVSPFAS